MAHFYGTLQGNRGQVTRCGTKSSGVEAIAASWSGAVKASVWYNEEEGRDYCEVSLIPWRNGSGRHRLLYRGPVNGEQA